MKNRIVSLTVATVVVLALVWNFSLLHKEQEESVSRQNRILAMQELTVFIDRMQMKLNINTQYADFFAVLLSRNPDLSGEELKEYADLFLEDNLIIKNVSFAPGGVVKHIFPLEGNEAALGHDLFGDIERNSFVEKAVITRNSVTQGPVKALQGGYLVFNRKPVFVKENGAERFWGLAVITIDFEKLVEDIDIISRSDGYLVALRAKKTDGVNDFLWGNAEIFEKDYISRIISLPDQQWELAIYPEKGWNPDDSVAEKMIWFFAIVIAGVFYTIYLHAQNYQEKLMASRRDPLTGTLNKQAFTAFVKKQLNQKKTKKRHGICVMDLNGFKLINDTYGHPAGDKVLIDVAHRIESVLRSSDRISRFGGDEYILFISDIEGRNDIENILSRVSDVIAEPFVYEGISINTCMASGYSVYPEDSTSYEELYEIADKRMYANKGNSQINSFQECIK